MKKSILLPIVATTFAFALGGCAADSADADAADELSEGTDAFYAGLTKNASFEKVDAVESTPREKLTKPGKWALSSGAGARADISTPGIGFHGRVVQGKHSLHLIGGANEAAAAQVVPIDPKMEVLISFNARADYGFSKDTGQRVVVTFLDGNGNEVGKEFTRKVTANIDGETEGYNFIGFSPVAAPTPPKATKYMRLAFVAQANPPVVQSTDPKLDGRTVGVRYDEVQIINSNGY